MHTDSILTKLMTTVTPVLKQIRAEIKESGKDIDEALEKGREIYARKPAIKNEEVTWSQEEYADLGLLFEYCRYKSIQRVTEAWSTFEKAKKKRLFEFIDRKIAVIDEKRNGKSDSEDSSFMRVASLGGGPGFELLAFKWFIEFAFHKQYEAKKHGNIELVSLDLAQSWEKICLQLSPSMKFNTFNLVKDGEELEEKSGGRVDVLLLSYVAKMYANNDECFEWISKKINDRKISIAFVISRDEKMEEFIRGFEKKGVLVTPLMEQTLGKDHRLLALSRRLDEDVSEAISKMKLEVDDENSKKVEVGGSGDNAADKDNNNDDGWTEVVKEKEVPPTFPNVPYQEHRKAKVDDYQSKKAAAGSYGTNTGRSESYSNFSRNASGKVNTRPAGAGNAGPSKGKW